jgi:hypothetical protein
MPLSEHEQRLLEQIERALYADDPKFASTVKSSNPRTWLRRRVVRSLLLFVLGLVVLVVGVAVNRPALTVSFGIVGFALMLFAALRGAAVHGAGRGALAPSLGRARPLSSAPAGEPGKPSHQTRDQPVARVQGVCNQRGYAGPQPSPDRGRRERCPQPTGP